MNKALSAPIPLPIASALAGFVLSYIFPGHVSPITWTFLGFLLGSLFARVGDWWLVSTELEARRLLEAESALATQKLHSELPASVFNA